MDNDSDKDKSSKGKGKDKGANEVAVTPTPLARKGSVDVVLPDGNTSNVEVQETEYNEEEVSKENRQGLLKVLSNAIGFDVTAITLPVTVNEPASFLMRLCEQLQYSDLLDKAATCEDSVERLTYIAAFSITCYTVAERTGKPFNPLLGETYEYVDESRDNFRFLGEQVSHHPPIGACHAETPHWKFWQSQCLKTKFSGNSLDCYVVGSNNVLIKSTGEHFKWEAIRTAVHNIIVGSLLLDHYGDCTITNKKTGEIAKLNFKPCGWFSKGWHEVTGEVYDAKGNACVSLVGKWNESLFAKAHSKFAERLNAETDSDSPLPTSPATPMSKKEEKKQEKKDKKEKKKLEAERKKEAKQLKKAMKKKLLTDEPIWVHTFKALPAEKLAVKYLVDWTEHTLKMVEIDDKMRAHLPPTDSRLRADRAWLEKGDAKQAAAAKHQIEEKQREERRQREKSSQEWTPRWFKLSKDEDGQDFYEYKGGYWEERQKRIDALEKQ